jgi:hypothetical protein
MEIWIGYDPREAIAFHTCVNSIIRHASKPVTIHPLALNNIPGYEEKHTDGSNQFIYSRFLVPWLMSWKGTAIFMDGDMVVTDDIHKITQNIGGNQPVHVVKHDYTPKDTTKYLGAKQTAYPRKNWSSVIVWNCDHFANRKLTPEFIQEATGEYLHRFQWLKDEQIGELDPAWNWLSQEFGPKPDAKLIHWTCGTPCFHEYATSEMSNIWHKERMLTNHSDQVL